MHVLKRLTIIVVVGTAADVYAGPLTYATCTACNLGACACYAAAGLTFGTVTLGAVAGGPITWWAWFFGGTAATGTAAATACSAAQGICMAACTPLLMVVSFFQWVLSPVVDFLQKLVWKMPKDKSVKQAKKTNGLVDKYLLIYNAVSCVAWGYTAFYRVIANIGDYPSTYSQIGNTLLILQTFALLEVFHALFKLVRSPVFTTAMQVASRLTMVWAVCNQFPEVANDWAYSTMALAWGLTEIIRYSFYALNLLGSDSEYFSFLTWCRYHFFYILYPVGAGSEFWLILAANKIAKENPDQKVLSYFFTFCQFIWPVGFYIMYSHMIKQRTKFVKDAKEKKETAKKAKKAE